MHTLILLKSWAKSKRKHLATQDPNRVHNLGPQCQDLALLTNRKAHIFVLQIWLGSCSNFLATLDPISFEIFMLLGLSVKTQYLVQTIFYKKWFSWSWSLALLWVYIKVASMLQGKSVFHSHNTLVCIFLWPIQIVDTKHCQQSGLSSSMQYVVIMQRCVCQFQIQTTTKIKVL